MVNDLTANLLKAIGKACNQAQSERRNDLTIYIQPDAWESLCDYAAFEAPKPMPPIADSPGPLLYGYEVAIITRQYGKRAEHPYVAIVGQISTAWAIGIGSDCQLTRLW